MGTPKLEALFKPLDIGRVRVRNRIMQVATQTRLRSGKSVTDDMVAFYEDRAKGGVGLIVMEPFNTPHPVNGRLTTMSRTNIGTPDEETLLGLSRLVSTVHAHGAKIVGQIHHGGRQHTESGTPTVVAPSSLPDPFSGNVPHELAITEIEEIVKGFADAATAMKGAGFDGVEIHAAQGHLIQEFLSGYTNHRVDRYGGRLENRLTFLKEILDRVDTAVGPELIVGLRFATEERSPNGIDLEYATEAVGMLRKSSRFDYLSLSLGNFNSIEIHLPDRTIAQATSFAHLKPIREAIQPTPMVVCGRILEPEVAHRIVEKGHADMVGLSRPLICDSEWASKAQADQVDRIRYCISCNQCWAEIQDGRPIRCVHNPSAGRERLWGLESISRAARPRRVVVVGGGPAGMEAARVAALRGHTVILFEQHDRLGGTIGLASRVPGQGEVGYVVDFLADAVHRAGVEVRLGKRAEATVDRVLDELPDCVVLATGAASSHDVLGVEPSFPVLRPQDVIDGECRLGKRTVLFDQDGYYEAAETAILAAGSGTKLTFVTRFFEAAREVPKTSRISVLRELDKRGVDIVTTTWFKRCDRRNIVLEHYYSGRETTIASVDSIVHVGAKSPNDNLYYALQGSVSDIKLIGDAFAPRRLMDAVREGHEAGRSL